MIYGVDCTKNNGPLAARKLVSLDFAGGVYTVNGVTNTVAAVVDKPSLVSSSGVHIIAGLNNEVAVIGSALAAMASLASNGFTLVLEWTETTPNDVIVFEQAALFGSNYVEFWNSANGLEMDILDTAPGRTSGDVFATWATAPSIKKAALTYGRAGGAALSLNGQAKVRGTAGPVASGLDTVTLGGFHGRAYLDGYIRKVVMFASVDDAALASLSA